MKLLVLTSLFLSLFMAPSSLWANSDADELERVIHNTAEDFNSYAPINVNGEVEESPEDASFFGTLFNRQAMEEIRKLMVSKFVKESPFKGMTKRQAESFILAFVQNKPVGQYIKDSPRLLSFLSDVMIHDNALPKLFDMLNKPKQWKQYGMFAIGVFIFSFVLNHFLNKKGGFFKKFFKKICISLGLLCLNFLVFYYLFRENLAPTFKLFYQNFN